MMVLSTKSTTDFHREAAWLEKEIVYFCRQAPLSTENGGSRRTVQLIDAMAGLDAAVVCALDYSDVPKIVTDTGVAPWLRRISPMLADSYVEWVRNRHTRQLYLNFAAESQEYYFKLYFIASYWENILKSGNPAIKLAFVDDPIYFAPLVEYFYRCNIPVVACSQNIETLSRSQIRTACQTAMMTYELDLFRKCSLVITISREETFLLKNLGIATHYFPYYPVEEICARMSAIRCARESSIKRDFLLLGTVWNPPTLHGMKAVLDSWQRCDTADGDRLLVAGYGTDQLVKQVATEKGVLFRGEITDEALDEMLTTCKGAIVYQEHGSGALTRVCEYLLAGVPVFANSHAARSYYNLPGIYEFETLEQLGDQMRAVTLAEQIFQTLFPPDAKCLRQRILGLLK